MDTHTAMQMLLKKWEGLESRVFLMITRNEEEMQPKMTRHILTESIGPNLLIDFCLF